MAWGGTRDKLFSRATGQANENVIKVVVTPLLILRNGESSAQPNSI
jgi:hypothetical protein